MRTLLFAACLFGLSALPAYADGPTAKVPYEAVDLQDQAGVAALYAKIVSTAKSLCRKEYPTGTPGIGLAASSNKCVRASVDNAIEAAGLTPLSSYHTALGEAERKEIQKTTLAAR